MVLDDGLLIDLVRQNPPIYDKENKNYKSKLIKENIWQTIATILSTEDEEYTGTTIEARWTILRNKFCTELRNIKNVPSGAGAAESTWPYFSAMSFLEKYIRGRKTRGSYDEGTQSQSPWDSMRLLTQLSETETDDDKAEEEAHVVFIEPEGVSGSMKTSKANVIDRTNVERKRLNDFKSSTSCPAKKSKKGKENEDSSDMEVFHGLTNTLDTIQNHLKNKNVSDDPDLNFGLVVGKTLMGIKNKKKNVL